MPPYRSANDTTRIVADRPNIATAWGVRFRLIVGYSDPQYRVGLDLHLGSVGRTNGKFDEEIVAREFLLPHLHAGHRI